MDYALNGELDIYFTEWDDFVTVDGLDEFKQSLSVQLQAAQRRLIGSQTNDTTLDQKLTQLITRVAGEYDVIDAIERITITRTNTATDTVRVDVTFATGDSFSETL